MKDFFGLLGCHIKRSVFSLAFIACTALCTLLMFFFAAEYLNPEQYHTLPGLHYFLSKIDQKGARYFVMMITSFPAAFAVFQSIIITNKHLTIISPVLIYILYFSFNFFYILPALANPFVLFWNGYKIYLEFGGTQDGSLFSPIASVYPMIFSAVFMIILPLVETKILRVKMNKSM